VTLAAGIWAARVQPAVAVPVRAEIPRRRSALRPSERDGTLSEPIADGRFRDVGVRELCQPQPATIAA